MIIAKINRFFAKHGKLAVIALIALMVLPLVFLYGVDGLRDVVSGRAGRLATIDGEAVTLPDFERQRRAIQFLSGGQTGGDRETAEAVAMRIMLLRRAKAQGLDLVDPAELKARIKAIPSFQTEDGTFDGAKYREFETNNLRPRGYSIGFFETVMRDNIVIGRVQGGVALGATVSDLEAFVSFQQNGIRSTGQVARFSASKYRAEMKPSDEEVAAWYKENEDKYRIQELSEIKAVYFSAAAVSRENNISDAELKAYYEDVWSRQASARHILKKYPANATDADKAKVRDVAQKILDQVKAGADFAELAKKESEDPGSGANGGDLGWFGPGRMVKPFEDAAFSLKDGEISGLVETVYGLHIIKKEGERKSPIDFETAKAQMAVMLQRQKDEAQAREIWATDPQYKQEQVRASQILIATSLVDSEDARAEKRQKAEALAVKLKQAPDTFAGVARKESADKKTSTRGGDLGWAAVGSHQEPAVVTALAELKDGDVSGVIEGAGGFYIVKKTGARSEIPMAEVERQIAAELNNERMKKAREVVAERAEAFLAKLKAADAAKAADADPVSVFEAVAKESGMEVFASAAFSAFDARVPNVPGNTFNLKRDGLNLSDDAPFTGVVTTGNDSYVAVLVGKKDGYLPELFDALPENAKPDQKPRLSKTGQRARNDLIGDLATKKALQVATAVRGTIAAALAEGKPFAEAKGDAEFEETGEFNPTSGPRGANAAEIAELARELQAGELSEAVEVNGGAVIFYLEGTTLPNVSEFAGMAPFYRQFYLDRRQSAVSSAMMENLKKAADIRYSGRLDYMNTPEESTDATEPAGDAG